MWVRGGIFYQVGVQGCIFFYNPPPRGGGIKGSLRAREENQRRVENKRREGAREGEREREGKGERKEKEKRIRVQIC